MNQSVLLVEDDDALRDSLAQTLEIEGITVIATAQFAQARRVIRANFNGVVLTDIRMPGADGFDVLALARGVDEELPVVMLTGEADVPMAIRAMKEGAWEFLEKPCSTDRLLEVLGRALRARALALRSRASEQRLRRGDLAAVNFPGRSDASRDLRRALRAAAEGRRPVVLTGPAGVGKKQAAHTLFHLMDTGGRFQAETVPLAGNFALAPDTRVLSLKRAERLGHDDAARLNAAGVDRANLRLIAATQGAVPGWIAARDPVEIAMPSLADRAPDVSVIFEELLRMAARNADRDMPPVTPDLLARVAGRD
ncbi:MAG: response regulator [Pseudomonadota bacterium]